MHANPYSWSITPRQIAERLHLSEKEAASFVEIERDQFDMFCKMKAERGKPYSSQLEAWRNWNSQYPPDLYWEMSDQSPYWEAELETILEGKIKPHNYDESGGQQ